MADLVIPCFVEDSAHRAFLGALIDRLLKEEGLDPDFLSPDFRNSTGGRGKAVTSLKRYFLDIKKGLATADPILIIMLDGNCQGANERKQEILKYAESYGLSRDQLVVGIPDPHVERWFLDSKALQAGVDHSATATQIKYKCERDVYKKALLDSFSRAGIFPQAGGTEYADDIIPHMNLYNPACGDRALKNFVQDLRASIKRLRSK